MTKEGKELEPQGKARQIKFRVRFDYKGRPKPARLFFGGKDAENMAEELRDQQMALWRNIPIQGAIIENIDLGETYTVHDEELEGEVSYAPMEVLVITRSIDTMVKFIVKEEFRRLDILEPESLQLNRQEIEGLFFKISEEIKNKVISRYKKARE